MPKDSVTFERAQDDVIAAMRGMRGLGPREENNFFTVASAQILDLFEQLTGVFFLVMMALSSTGLLVGGVGVIGIMLISVTERTREIGIRKAIGARRRSILMQFLLESAVICLIGGLIGIAIAAIITVAINAADLMPASISPGILTTAVIVSVLVGVVAGFVPALRGAKLDPIEALRYE